jgi:hypothetical protein
MVTINEGVTFRCAHWDRSSLHAFPIMEAWAFRFKLVREHLTDIVKVMVAKHDPPLAARSTQAMIRCPNLLIR